MFPNQGASYNLGMKVSHTLFSYVQNILCLEKTKGREKYVILVVFFLIVRTLAIVNANVHGWIRD